ncbi:hypothetical protein M422DRAFT_31065, partial [Sphaerobolus stellatus SS14]
MSPREEAFKVHPQCPHCSMTHAQARIPFPRPISAHNMRLHRASSRPALKLPF